jgi:hypothetical protein
MTENGAIIHQIALGRKGSPSARCANPAFGASWSIAQIIAHYVTASADPWPDQFRLSDLEPRFVCSACGKVRGEHQARFLLGQAGPDTADAVQRWV